MRSIASRPWGSVFAVGDLVGCDGDVGVVEAVINNGYERDRWILGVYLLLGGHVWLDPWAVTIIRSESLRAQVVVLLQNMTPEEAYDDTPDGV